MALYSLSGSYVSDTAVGTDGRYNIWTVDDNKDLWSTTETGIFYNQDGNESGQIYSFFWTGNEIMKLSTGGDLTITGQLTQGGAPSNAQYIATKTSTAANDPHFGIDLSNGTKAGMRGAKLSTDVPALIFSVENEDGSPVMVDVLVMSGSIATGNNPIIIEGEDLKVNGTITQGGSNVLTAESDTLATVTSRGATTSDDVTFSGNITGSARARISTQLTVGGIQYDTAGVLVIRAPAGDNRNLLIIQTNSNADDRGLAFRNSGGAYSNAIWVKDVGGGTNDGDLYFSGGNATSTITDLTDHMIISASGNVGIGAAPTGTEKLQVNGGISANQYTGNGSSLTNITLDNAVTFTTTGGAGAGATFDGSSAVTIDYTTVGAASSGHTHTAAAISAGTFPAGTFTLADTGILVLDGTAKLQMDDSSGLLDVLSSANSETLSIGNSGFTTVNVLGGSTINLQATNVQANGTNVLTSNQTITLSGDVGGSGTTSITATIQPDSVTYAKMQNVVSADRLLGSTSAGGPVSELDAGTVRGMLNVEDGATGDQTNAEIRAAVEAATDSNVFTDADHTKLNGIESGADVTDATNVEAAGAVMETGASTITGDLKITTGTFIYENNSTQHGFIPHPGGGWLRNAGNPATGAIEISLPTFLGSNSDMISFWVDVFDYREGESFSVYIAGYAYQAVDSWVYPTAIVFTTDSNKDLTVRFDEDGTRRKVWIGETSSTWHYLQVVVRDFQGGLNTDIDAYADDWDINVVGSVGTEHVLSNNWPRARSAQVIDVVSTNGNSNDTTTYPLLVPAASTGYQEVHIDSSALSYNASTNTLTAGTFSGNGSGLSSVNATTLDSLDSTSFLRSDTADTAAGNITFTGTNGIYFNDNNTNLDEGSGNAIRVTTNSGYCEIGPQNSTYSHFQTDRGLFYFNKETVFNNAISSYDADFVIKRGGPAGTRTTKMTIGSSNVQFVDDIVPDTDNTGNVGTSSLTWNNGRFTNLTIDSTLNVRGAIDLADNDVLRFGSADDYTIDFDSGQNDLQINCATNTQDLVIKNSGGTEVFTFDMGTNTFNATGDVTVSSDIRLKNELPDIVQGLEVVDKIRPIKYTLKGDEDENPKIHLGFSAQELLDIVPEVVSTTDDGYYSVSYGKLVPVLVKAIQELTEEVRELKKKVGE